MNKFINFLPHGLGIFSSIIFLSALPYKFSNHPNTQEIFGRLDTWAATFGAPGLFAQSGLFSQYAIGAAELIASILLLLGIFPAMRRMQGLGAILGCAIMTGAISFHLFTPLGIDPNNDGGGLFAMAVLVWCSCLVIIFLRRSEIGASLAAMKTALWHRA